MQEAARLGRLEPLNGWLALILFLLPWTGFWAYLQGSLNHLWRSEAELPRGQAASRHAG